MPKMENLKPIKNERGAGRKPTYAELGAMRDSTVRLPVSYWDYVRQNGGAGLIRRLVSEEITRAQK